MGDYKIVLQNITAGIPECWEDHFRLKKACYGTIVCEDDHWKGTTPMRCPNSTKANYMERKSFASIDIFVCVGLKVFEPNAIGAYVFCLDWSFWFGSSSIIRANPAAVKLASDMTISCLFFSGCFKANWQDFSRSLLRLVKTSTKFVGT